jgi:hypothetical protein
MVVALNGWLERARMAIGTWRRTPEQRGRCRSCGTPIDPVLDECLLCLGGRHW